MTWDARYARGFTRWLVRQRDRDDRVGALARRARMDPGWPYREVERSALHSHLEPRYRGTFALAWEEYLMRNETDLEVQVDWSALSWQLGTTRDASTDDVTTSARLQDRERLLRAVADGDSTAARALLTIARRTHDTKALTAIRDLAIDTGDWSLVCETLAAGDEAFIEATFELARGTGHTYLLDRTIELGSEPFLHRIYEEARHLPQPDSLHIALAAAKALMPETFEDWRPAELLHAAAVGVPHSKLHIELPPLRDD